jgi:non-ribosomal peptide synthetase component F
MTWVEQLCAIHEHSGRPAVIDETGSVTGRELVGKAVGAAELLAGLDVAAGQPIPALLTTNADALALLLGGAAANRPLAPLGPRQTPTELAEMVRRSGSPVMLTESQFAETARQVAEMAGIRALTIPSLPVSSRPLHRESGAAAIYLHTAGTTGVPKRVPLTEQVLDARAEVLSGLICLGPDDRYATGSPVHHMGGLGNALVALTVGAAVISTTNFSFDWWCNLKALDATHCQLVPTMIEMLVRKGLLDAVPLKVLIYGASPIARCDKVSRCCPMWRWSAFTARPRAARSPACGPTTIDVLQPGIRICCAPSGSRSGVFVCGSTNPTRLEPAKFLPLPNTFRSGPRVDGCTPVISACSITTDICVCADAGTTWSFVGERTSIR